LRIFLNQFTSAPVGLLAIAAGLSLATGGISDAVAILAVVTINAVIGYTTEAHSDRIIRSLQRLIQPSAQVVRDGQIQDIAATDLVVGDLLLLQPGTYVPADARILRAERLSIDESALTGESVPANKQAEALPPSDTPLADRNNMVYLGTLVTGGQGMAIVVGTGATTEMGQIQTLVGEAALPQTPMERQLNRVGNQLAVASTAVCGLVFGIGLLRGYSWLRMLKTSISLAVAAVPEGLPTVATTTLALGIQNMRRQRVLIRRLDAVETLGCLQSLCLDKTGTLTENHMKVAAASIEEQWIDDSADPGITPEPLQGSETREQLLKTISLCNECELHDTDGHLDINGSATERALLEWAIAQGIDIVRLRQQFPRQRVLYRAESRNFMLTAHQTDGPKQFVAVKGNPREVLELCTGELSNGQLRPLRKARRAALELENERMASQGLRVLGIACGYVAPDEELDHLALTWLGLVGLADPIRQGVREVLATLHGAGIETIMITGDQGPTAYAIGKALDLSFGQPLNSLDATDLSYLPEEAVSRLCDQVHVFARISPAHKLQIVRALQQAGKVVAMTGDGINDAPALKAAEVGIAMGGSGTDVAREVADVVLEDDNLSTMANAVSQGRTIYSNIRKSVHFLLATNLSEVIVTLAGTAIGISEPLSPLQLLWINLVTDVFPALALAMERPEPDILLQPPRDPTEPLLRRSDFGQISLESLLIASASLGAYSYGLRRYGPGLHSGTVTFMSLVMAELMHSISCRSTAPSLLRQHPLPPNPYLAIALSGSVGLQLLCLAIPGLRRLLQVTPLNFLDALVISGSALLPLAANELIKLGSTRPIPSLSAHLGSAEALAHEA
jgi:Ca2+-transporting ATPase